MKYFSHQNVKHNFFRTLFCVPRNVTREYKTFVYKGRNEPTKSRENEIRPVHKMVSCAAVINYLITIGKNKIHTIFKCSSFTLFKLGLNW